MRIFRSGTVLLLAVLVVFGLANIAGGSAAPTGNPKTIAFYRAVVNATRQHKGVVSIQTGFVTMSDELKSSSFSYFWGRGTSPPGYVRAVEHITIAAANRHVVWVTDDMVPEGCTAGAGGSCLPVEFLLSSSGVLWRFDSARLPPSSLCWSSSAAKGDVVGGYSKIGVAFGYALYGYFYPMKRVGGNEYVTSTFPWGKTQKATEVDKINLATHLPASSIVRIASATGLPAFTYSWTNQWLKNAPLMPQATLCG